MKRVITSILSSALLFAGISPAAAQFGPPPPAPDPKAKPIHRLADGRPDFNGVWWFGGDVPVQGLNVNIGERPPSAPPLGPLPGSFGALYKPEYMEKAKLMGDKEDPTLSCVPSVLGQGIVFQLVQTPKFLVELIETFHGFRIIPTDGRAHSDEFPPSFKGDGVGRWEGDEFVVTVTNYDTGNWILDHGDVSFHSDKLRSVQRYRLLDADTLEISRTFEDPEMLTAPWTTKLQVRRAPFDRIMETFCSGVETKALIDYSAQENYGRKR